LGQKGRAFGAALALSLALLGAERALAAELPMPGPAPIPPNSYYPVSPPLNWGGVYIGLNSGYGLGSSNWSNTLGSTGTFAANGGVVGGTLGINYAGFGDWVLLGLEGDFDWSGASGSAACSVLGPGVLGPNATCQTRIVGKEASDDRVERSLYQLAIGWNGQPPNTTAAIFWLKNRRPDRWRDVQQLQNDVGVYLISDHPLTEQEWIEQRASANAKRIDATPVRQSEESSTDTET
jgi:hypothetical protein